VGNSVSNRTVRYTAGEIGRFRVIKDFQPRLAELVPREDNVKVTLSLSRRSFDFFKREARKRRVPHQHDPRACRYPMRSGRQAAGNRRVGKGA
jgi:hypothetical protein